MRLPIVTTVTHIIYTYHIGNGSFGSTEYFNSDGDHGTWWELLKHMCSSAYINTVRIGTRVCSPFSRIGKRRFEHLNQITSDVKYEQYMDLRSFVFYISTLYSIDLFARNLYLSDQLLKYKSYIIRNIHMVITIGQCQYSVLK